MWRALIEVWLTNQLIRSRLFNRGVRAVHKKVHELQHGKDPAELGGTNIDKAEYANRKGFLKYFMEEIKAQLRGESPPPPKDLSPKALPPPHKK